MEIFCIPLDLDRATVSLIVSIATAGFAWSRTRVHKKDVADKARYQLMNHATAINNAFVNTGVRSPYFVFKKYQGVSLSQDQEKNYIKKSIMVFHHLNMLREVFLNRKALPSGELDGYIRWYKETVRPWIEDDADLTDVWDKVMEKGDIYPDDFLNWLKSA